MLVKFCETWVSTTSSSTSSVVVAPVSINVSAKLLPVVLVVSPVVVTGSSAVTDPLSVTIVIFFVIGSMMISSANHATVLRAKAAKNAMIIFLYIFIIV